MAISIEVVMTIVLDLDFVRRLHVRLPVQTVNLKVRQQQQQTQKEAGEEGDEVEDYPHHCPSCSNCHSSVISSHITNQSLVAQCHIFALLELLELFTADPIAVLD